MNGDYYKPGSWNWICDRCGFRYKAEEAIKEWTGLMVCRACHEPRHPQTYLKVPPEKISVPWARPEGEDVFIPICYIWASSAYAGLAEAGCARAGYVPMAYDLLFDLKWNEIPPWENPLYYKSAIPGYAIPGYAIPSTTITGP